MMAHVMHQSFVSPRAENSGDTAGLKCQDCQESEVAEGLAHWLLVLEVPGSIPAGGEENLLVRTRFPLCHLQDAPSFGSGR